MLLLSLLSSAGAVVTDKSGRAVEVDLVATDVDSAAFSHTLNASTATTVGMGEWGGRGRGRGRERGRGRGGYRAG